MIKIDSSLKRPVEFKPGAIIPCDNIVGSYHGKFYLVVSEKDTPNMVFERHVWDEFIRFSPNQIGVPKRCTIFETYKIDKYHPSGKNREHNFLVLVDNIPFGEEYVVVPLSQMLVARERYVQFEKDLNEIKN